MSQSDIGRTPGAEELAARKQLSLQKIRKARKLLAASRNSAPQNIAVPGIPRHTLEEIANLIPMEDAEEIIGRVFAYWRLKRESRFGVPLLRRLQCQKSKLVSGGGGGEGGSGNEVGGGFLDGEAGTEERRELRNILRTWRGLRQDLERVRLLCELLRKREKLKVEHIGLAEEVVERLWRPTGRAFVDCVEKMMEKDRFQVFGTAVKEDDVPGYRAIISTPVDLGTMHDKASKGQYKSWADLHDDFKLMIDNCTKFNRNNATFYKYGLRMKRLGMQVIKSARESTGSSLGGSSKDIGIESLGQVPICIAADVEPFPRVEFQPPPPIGKKRKQKETPAPSSEKPKSMRDYVKRKDGPPSPKKPKLTAAFKEFRALDPRSPELSSAASSEEIGSESETLPKALRNQPEHQSPSQEEEEGDGSEFGYLLEHPRPLDMVWAPFVLSPAAGSRRGTRAWLPAIVIEPNMPEAGITVQGMELEAPPAAIKARDPNTDIQDEHEIRVLVRFFDPNLTWEWVAFIDLFHFVNDERIDGGRLSEPKKAADKAAVQHAFDRAKVFWCRMNSEEVPDDVGERLSPGKKSRCSVS